VPESSCINFSQSTPSFSVNRKKMTLMAETIAESLCIHHYVIDLHLVGAKVIRELNREFRHKDYVTDVLSFPQLEWKKPLKVISQSKKPIKRRVLNPQPIGDVIICLQKAKANAIESGHGLDFEVVFLMVHGILHLVGHDHIKKSDETKMTREHEKLMALFADNKKLKSQFKGCVAAKKKSPAKSSKGGQRG
jgi:probable rRNA maturation factor